jgi:hypothetical protein
MDQKQYFKQMIAFTRTAFDGSFTALVSFQEQADRMNSSLLDQAAWLPKEGRKAIGDWADACRKGREEFKKMVDESFQKVEAYFGDSA